MGFSSTAAAAAFLTVAVLVAASGVAEGQSPQSDCISQLVTCYNDLNATNPSRGCCDAIRTVVSTQLRCLCDLYRNQAALGGINMTQAMSLPTRCQISNDVSACDALSPTGSTSPPPPPPGATGRDGNDASMRSWMGTTTLLLVSALTFLY